MLKRLRTLNRGATPPDKSSRGLSLKARASVSEGKIDAEICERLSYDLALQSM